MSPIFSSQNLASKDYPLLQRLDLDAGPNAWSAGLFLGCLADLNSTEMLHPAELERYHAYPDGLRKKSYLAGRYAAKSALGLLLENDCLHTIEIASGIFHQPVVHGAPYQVSISHCGDWAAAVAFPEECSLGIDIERVGERLSHLKNLFLTPAEMALLPKTEAQEALALTMFWTLKEALSKALKTGLTIPIEQLEVSAIQQIPTGWEGHFGHFSAFKGRCFEVPHSGIIGALVLPRDVDF